MALFVLVPGAGGQAAYWVLLVGLADRLTAYAAGLLTS